MILSNLQISKIYTFAFRNFATKAEKVSSLTSISSKRLVRLNRAVSADTVQRIERIISNRGLGSRSEVNKLLRSNKVKVDGKTVK